MAKVLEIDPKEHRAGLYDSDTGQSLTTDKVVDVTEDLPGAQLTVFLYTTAKRGLIVQITHPNPGEVYMGVHTHFVVDELKRATAPRDDTFAVLAKRAGVTRDALRKMVVRHAPRA